VLCLHTLAWVRGASMHLFPCSVLRCVVVSLLCACIAWGPCAVLAYVRLCCAYLQLFMSVHCACVLWFPGAVLACVAFLAMCLHSLVPLRWACMILHASVFFLRRVDLACVGFLALREHVPTALRGAGIGWFLCAVLACFGCFPPCLHACAS
jgi:hypothetical protein